MSRAARPMTKPHPRQARGHRSMAGTSPPPVRWLAARRRANALWHKEKRRLHDFACRQSMAKTGEGERSAETAERQLLPGRIGHAAGRERQLAAELWPFSLLRRVRTLIPSIDAARVRLPPQTASARAMSCASASPTSSEVSTTASEGTP